MKEETAKTLEQALVDILEKTVSGIEKGADFLMAELPDVIYQLLLWHGVEGFILFIFGIAMFISPFILWRKVSNYKKSNELGWGSNDMFPLIITQAVVSILAWLFCWIPLNLTWLKIWLAPKVWLIEYAAELVK